MKTREQRVEEVKRSLRKKSRHFHKVFSTVEGKEVLAALHSEFDGVDIRGEDSHNTYYNLGRRDVVKYIDQMIVFNEVDTDE